MLIEWSSWNLVTKKILEGRHSTDEKRFDVFFNEDIVREIAHHETQITH